MINKEITFNDIERIVKTSMEFNLSVKRSYNAIIIEKDDNYIISIDLNSNIEIYNTMINYNILSITTPNGFIRLELNCKEYNKFKVLLDEVKDYSENKAKLDISDFFNDIKEKPTNIDDLDED